MDLFDLILKNAMWWVFVFLLTFLEATMFAIINPDKKQPLNPHIPLELMRILVYVAIFQKPYLLALETIPLMLMFPFIHDGFYYYLRNQWEPSVYPEKWKAETHTSNAYLNLTYKKRVIYFIAGAIIYIGVLTTLIITHK